MTSLFSRIAVFGVRVRSINGRRNVLGAGVLPLVVALCVWSSAMSSRSWSVVAEEVPAKSEDKSGTDLAEKAVAQAVKLAADDRRIPGELLVEIQQLQDPSDKLIRTENLPERILASNGKAAKLLTAAGVKKVAKDELVGLVIDAHGRPVADVSVDANSWYPGNETTTDEQGLFRLKGLDAAQHVELLVTKQGYSPRLIMTKSTGRKEFIVILRDQTYFEGTVLGEDKQPVKGAIIHASCGPFQPDPGYSIGSVPFEATSGDDGKFRLYVFPNQYDFMVSAPGRGAARLSGIAVEQNEHVDVPIQLEKGIRFEAIVVDSETDQPVEGFVLFRWQPPKIMGRSDAAGKIVLDDLFPGALEFNCGSGDKKSENGMEFYQHGSLGRWWSPDAVHEHQQRQIDDAAAKWQRNFDDLTFQLQSGMLPVKIVVEQGVTITGRVTDPAGNPVEGATVAPAKTGSGNSLTGDTRYSVSTDKDGRYHTVMPASNDAEYNLVVHDGKYEEWRKWANGVSKVFQTKPGQVIDNFDLQLTVPAVIRGKVTSFGKPVAGREVRAQDFDKLENRYYDPTVTTAADGTYELKFVRPGKHYVQAKPFWYDDADPKGSCVVEVEAGDTLEDVDFTVEGQ